MSEKQIIPVWFFVGLLLLVYGTLIAISGVAEWQSPPATVRADLHAPVWWGAVMLVLGSVWVFAYWPGRKAS
jgi:energy-converting hydrogenase Eha subunit E